MRSFCLVGLVAVFLLAAGCAQAEPEVVDLAAERASLLEADERFFSTYAGSSSPADSFVDHMIEDGLLLPPGAPLATGKEAIRQVIANLESLPEFAVSWSPSTAEVGDDGSLGYTVGNYTMQMGGPDGKPMLIDGKYLTVWRKQADGGWKIEADMFNPDGEPVPIEE